ncbi:MAG: hypothetical protein JKY96_01795 [Phycisphaerales bacterium]|nr:hypothetical protein [Phycisphaerales bacterium]
MDQTPPSSPPPTPDDYGEQASRLAELGSLWTILAHEINNLMTKAQGHAQLALQSRPSQDASTTNHNLLGLADNNGSDPYDALDRLLLAIKRTTHLTESIMRYTDPNPSPVSEIFACEVHEAHEAALGFLLPSTAASESEAIEYVTAWNTQGIQAQIDPIALEQILINLYLNAEQAIAARQSGDPHSPQTILVNATRECSTWNTHHGSRIRLTIQDTGNGIDPNDLDSIFDLWNQGSSRAQGTGSSKGHGLGLAVCKRLISEAGGTIRCESTPGMGTTFTIVLPGYDAKTGSHETDRAQAA